MNSFLKSGILCALVFVGSVCVVDAFDHSHKDWDSIVRDHVIGEEFDYAAALEDASLLDQYLAQLDSVGREELDSWSREKQLAFWINAYNAFTVRVILDYYPIDTWTFKGLVVPRNSIIQIPGVWKKITWEVAGQSLTLDHIEHSIIRPVFGEPRIHFAIVCASVGCPHLRPEAFTSDKLEHQLEDQARMYLLNTNKGVRLGYDKKCVDVSKLFKWFNDDFEVPGPEGFRVERRSQKERNILNFIAHYLTDPKARELLQSPEVEVGYLSYDWSLNEPPRSDDSV